MKPIFAAIILALFWALTATPALAADSGTMQSSAQAFYAAYESVPHGGVPDAASRAKLDPLLSPTLSGLLDKAANAEQAFAQQTKGAEAPLLEGDIFTSLFEGATSFSVEACSGDGKTGHCAVALSYADPNEKPVTWTDTVYLVNTALGWKADDVGYGGTWAFGNKGRLSQILKDTIANIGG